MARKSLTRNAKPQQDFAQELTLTCPILEMGRLASSETVHSINTICLHDECQWWSVRSSNCIVHEFPGVLSQLNETVHFMLPARKETPKVSRT